MSNEERVSWVALVVNLVIGFGYFSHILALPADTDLGGGGSARFAASLVIAAVVLSIACEVALRIFQRASGEREGAAPRDERDALIGLKATRNAHRVLTATVIVVLVQIAVIDLLLKHRGPRFEPATVLELLVHGPLESMHFANLLLFALTLTAITLNASRVFYYRRGY